MSHVAVVTGASAGIGEAIAARLLSEGHTVIALQRRQPRIAHERLIYRNIDLADAAATASLAEDLARRYPVRLLVNNAGANRPGPLDRATVEDLDYAMAVNVRAAVILAKAFVPGMREAKFGRIVSMSSRAMMGKTQRVVYSAAKAALIGMTRTLALELAADGITVNAVAPGPVATDLFDNGHPHGSEKRKKVIDSVPVRRVGTPDEVARAVAFLLHADSGYITGQTLFVCGGTSVSGTGGE
ncbi:MAG TPA: SDR family oxidoreductase [Burkholderiales bacterium]|nr:SDR family oxidoreductase [Burkholderiales bacterium]